MSTTTNRLQRLGNLTPGITYKRTSSASPRLSLVLIGFFGVGLAVLMASVDSPYLLTLFTTFAIWASLAVSWNIFCGITGYLSLGHAAFFGVGAYAFAMLVPTVGFLAALALSGVISAGFGLVLGTATLGLRGLYFTLATIGLAEVLRLTVLGAGPVTGGGAGLTVFETPGYEMVFLMAASVLIALLMVNLILLQSRTGRRLIAIADDEEALEAAGVRVRRHKILWFSVSAAAAGVIGGIYAMQVAYVAPETVFPLLVSLRVVIIVLLGGLATLWGPVLAAAALTFGEEMLWARYPLGWEIILGTVLVGAVLLLPQGIVGWLITRFPTLRRHIL